MIEFLIIAITFYFIGKYSQTNKEKELLESIKLKPKHKPIESIRQKTPEERAKIGTDEEAVEKEMIGLFKNIFKK